MHHFLKIEYVGWIWAKSIKGGLEAVVYGITLLEGRIKEF